MRCNQILKGILFRRRELDDQRSPIAEDIRLARTLQNRHHDISQCLEKLEDEWSQLCDDTEAWQNKVDNTLTNLRIFEKEMRTFEDK